MYDIHEKVVLRTPRFSIDSFLGNRKHTDKIQHARFLESLYLASPGLAGMLSEKDEKKIAAALPAFIKYLSRSSFRCTPYGLFAGISTVHWGETTEIIFGKEKRCTRLDMHYIHELASHVSRQAGILRKMNFTANSTVYPHGNKLRYLEYIARESKRYYDLSEVDRSAELEKILATAATGAPYHDLVGLLCSDGIPRGDAEAFVLLLIENQLLISELEPAVTGPDSLLQLIGALQGADLEPALIKLQETLAAIHHLLKTLDHEGTNPIGSYKKMIALLEELPVPYQENKIFQVDLFKSLEKNSLHHLFRRRIKDGLNILAKLTSRQPNERLEKFKNRFRDRYENREMPLMEVLDTESGIGYPDLLEGDITSLLQDVTLPPSENKTFTLTKINQWLIHKLHDALFHNQYTVNIEKEALNDFESCWDFLPTTFPVMFRVTNFADQEIYIETAGGSGAVPLLGRFAYGDPEIMDLVSDIIVAEQKQNPGAVYAEIVHIPENRLGNIAIHPAFFQHEIPCLSRSSVSGEHRICLQDLHIKIENSSLKLLSKTLKKEVIARLSNAHNYNQSEVAVYRFLCDLQHQHSIPALSFNWGPLSGKYVFLPRVTHGKIILHLATWNLPKAEIEKIVAADEEGLQELISVFRKKWKMPRYVVLAEYDNELFVDFEDPGTLKAWIHAIRTKQSITLKEFLFDPDSRIKDQHGERYVNQFVASAIKTMPPSGKMDPVARRAESYPQRKFIPGSEWVMFKYYCSPATADSILVQTIKPLTERLLQDELVRSWFFVRYKDDKTHLRVRFRLTDPRNFGELVRLCNAGMENFISDQGIWKLQLDTYEREIERYGHDLMEHSEDIFFHDSTAVLDFLCALRNTPEKEEMRWLWGMRSADHLMNDFQFSLDEKIELMQLLKNAFATEFSIKKPTEMQLDKKYRKYRPEIESILSLELPAAASPLSDIIDNKSKKIESSAGQLMKLQGQLSGKDVMSGLLQSHIHMTFNRLLQHSQRSQEMILYDFMHRYYRSQKARKTFI